MPDGTFMAKQDSDRSFRQHPALHAEQLRIQLRTHIRIRCKRAGHFHAHKGLEEFIRLLCFFVAIPRLRS